MNTAVWLRKLAGAECCESEPRAQTGLPKILIVGSPNVGKSLLFHRLTGRYVSVSNYPGTTVEVSRGRSEFFDSQYEIVDTPGMFSLSSITEEEKVSVSMLRNERAHAVVHVIDAKNIERMLGLTLQLMEAGLPLVLVLNMTDEARRLGIRIDVQELSRSLGIPVIETVATTREGLQSLFSEIAHIRPPQKTTLNYGPELEPRITAIAELLSDTDGIAKRTRAIFLLEDDPTEIETLILSEGSQKARDILQSVSQARSELPHAVHYYTTLAGKTRADEILNPILTLPSSDKISPREKISRLCMHPVSGTILVLAALYFGLYKFVGEFGAGTLVDYLEGPLFGENINPRIEELLAALIPWQSVYDLFAGPYGIITLGVRYAVAIVLPIVATFFIAFSVLEDSGYLPRLALLVDRVCKKIGLNGRAVIPMVLGFGCDTMATMVTRTLETKREKIIACVLLALAVPCSAQLGVILGLLAGHPYALLVWAGFVGGVFLAAGSLTAKLLPGERPSFYMELPPMRLPRPGNVLTKTYTRVIWYFKEILPLFILASILIWLGRITGLFQLTIRALQPLVNLIGLPDEAAVAFLFGFFRRDYGAAGLFDLQQHNLLTGNQLAVAAITLTLFLPCVAQFLMMKKERGLKLTLAVSAVIVVLAFLMGFLAHTLLNALGVEL